MSKFVTLDGIRELKEKLTVQMAAAISEAEHLKYEIVAQLPNVAEADPNTIYLVKKGTADGESNAYDEYFVISGKFEHIGDTKADLTDYAKTADVISKIATAKNEAIEAAKQYADGKSSDYATAKQGAAADTAVQSVKIGSKELKSGTGVTLPEATGTEAGVMSAKDKTKLDGIVEATIAEIDALFE